MSYACTASRLWSHSFFFAVDFITAFLSVPLAALVIDQYSFWKATLCTNASAQLLLAQWALSLSGGSLNLFQGFFTTVFYGYLSSTYFNVHEPGFPVMMLAAL